MGQSGLARPVLPTSAVLEMTYRCNHRCIFCSCPWFAPAGDYDIRPELTTEQWEEAISHLCAMGVCDFAFTGGEPLLKEGLEEIVAHTAGCTCQHLHSTNGELRVETGRPVMSLLSNGRAMSDAVLEMCHRFGIRLSMSLPGLRTFGDHTGGGDAQGVLQWFARAKAMGIRTTVGITVTRANLHELYETIAGALLAGADSLLLNRFLPGGRGLEHPDLNLNREEVRRMLETAEEVLSLANRYGSVGTELPLCVVGPMTHRHLEVGSRCSAAGSFFAVDPSGFIRVCNHSPIRLKHVSEAGLLRHDAYWRRFALRDHSPRQCSGCRQRMLCDGGCREAAHLLAGGVDGPDMLLGDTSMRVP